MLAGNRRPSLLNAEEKEPQRGNKGERAKDKEKGKTRKRKGKTSIRYVL